MRLIFVKKKKSPRVQLFAKTFPMGASLIIQMKTETSCSVSESLG